MGSKDLTVGKIVDLGGDRKSKSNLPTTAKVKHEGVQFRDEIAIKIGMNALQDILSIIDGGSCGCCQGCDAEFIEAAKIAREALGQMKAGRA